MQKAALLISASFQNFVQSYFHRLQYIYYFIATEGTGILWYYAPRTVLPKWTRTPLRGIIVDIQNQHCNGSFLQWMVKFGWPTVVYSTVALFPGFILLCQKSQLLRPTKSEMQNAWDWYDNAWNMLNRQSMHLLATDSWIWNAKYDYCHMAQ